MKVLTSCSNPSSLCEQISVYHMYKKNRPIDSLANRSIFLGSQKVLISSLSVFGKELDSCLLS